MNSNTEKTENNNKDIEISKGPEDAPDLSEEGRPISRLIAGAPKIDTCYADLFRVALDKQGMTQIQFGMNDPYERDLGIITNIVYLSPRGMGVLLRLLIENYRKFEESSPELVKDLTMPRLQDLIADE